MNTSKTTSKTTLPYAINEPFVYIHKMTIEDFMEYKPPCDNCLIQSMCIQQHKDFVHSFIKLNKCDNLMEFIDKIGTKYEIYGSNMRNM